jgi:hypothetical protein
MNAAFRSHNRGSLVLKGTFGGIRLERASGTNDPRMLARLKEMLHTIAESGGRLDLVRGIQQGLYKPLALWEHYRQGDWESLPTPQSVQPLIPFLEAWRDGISNVYTKRAAVTYVKRMLEHAGPRATVADIPAALTAYRAVCKQDGTGSMFNHTRSAMQGLVESQSALWSAITKIEPLEVTNKRTVHPQRPAPAWAIAQALPPKSGRIWWILCCTGMGTDEYFEGKWALEDGRLRVKGTKRKSRDRIVPRLVEMSEPDIAPETFKRHLRESGLGVQPYDGRRSFMNWMVEAKIPRPRRKMYLGHGSRDSTDLYERPELEQWLADDEDRLKRLLSGIIGGTTATNRGGMVMVRPHRTPRATKPTPRGKHD